MTTTEMKKYIIAKVNKEQYGIDIKYVDNIIVMQNITRVPKAQSYFKGVINLRGDIIPIMSLRLKLGLEPDVITPKTRIIIVKPELQAAVGILVDEVKEVVDLNNSDIDILNYEDKDDKLNYSIGIGKHHNDLINILNLTGLIIEKESEQ